MESNEVVVGVMSSKSSWAASVLDEEERSKPAEAPKVEYVLPRFCFE